MSVSIESTQKRDEENCRWRHQVQEEDPIVKVEVSQELRQTILHCQGELHLLLSNGNSKISKNLHVKIGKPRFPIETIRNLCNRVIGTRTIRGAGQFGEVYMQVEPYYEGMPDPKGMSVRGREEYPLIGEGN
jgi:elongation factor G